MTRCANCNKKWKAKVIWSLMNRPLDGKNCPHCYRIQYIKPESLQFMNDPFMFSFVFTWLLGPFFVKLSNEQEPWNKFDQPMYL